jgi:hypothetical protein
VLCVVLPLLLIAIPVVLSGCDAEAESRTPAELAELQLRRAQVAIEGAMHGGSSRIAVLGVLDSSAIAAKAVAGSEQKGKTDSAALAAALGRERKARAGLNASFVQNRLLEMLQPSETDQATAHDDMLRGNSAALSQEQCRQLSGQLGAEFLVNALVDEEGKAVTVAVQQADGVVVFQDTLKHWPAVVAEDAATE